ncbi:MAG: pyridoxal phosphate-dependent aminotransferase [Acidobacteriota bacterium]|nr:pyridoxal phosphate-dependent aminotransferase [Acidobacteriota bacterium]
MASRLSLVGTSPTIAVKMEADRLRREGVEVVDFGPGEPDLPSPDAVKQAGILAIEEDFTHYTAAGGIHALREALARHYSEVGGRPVDPAEVLVGVGGKSLLFAAMMALLNPGDEAVIFSPYWVSFPEQVRLAGGVPVFASLSAGDGFTIRAAALEKALTPATRMVIVNSPCNPSGSVIPRQEAAAIAELVVEHDLWLVSDETYESFVYDPADAFSFLSLREELASRLVFVSAFSKTWAMTGWRIGYAVADPEVIRALLTVQSHDTTHPSSISQRAALAALEKAAAAPRQTLEVYRRRRRRLVDGLARVPGVVCPEPKGAFYAYPDVRGLIAARGLESSAALARALIQEEAVATVPGEAFGTPGHLRLSYAAAEAVIDEGLIRLARFAGA